LGWEQERPQKTRMGLGKASAVSDRGLHKGCLWAWRKADGLRPTLDAELVCATKQGAGRQEPQISWDLWS
jgi:hypothetical protein